MTDQPQPGDVWERDVDRREVVTYYAGVIQYLNRHGNTEWMWDGDWLAWHSGATLIQRKEPTQ